MRKSNKEIAEQLVELSGGVNNIVNNTTCMTRLHIRFKDRERIDIDAIKAMESALGVVDGETIQIVFGPGKVVNIGNEFSNITNIPLGSEHEFLFDDDDDEPVVEVITKPENVKRLSPLAKFFKHFANIFLPLLPGIAGAGLINGITRAINISNNNAYTELWWYALIITLGWAMFAYLPIFVGMNAAKEFKGTAILGGIGGALSVMNTSMPLLSMVNGQSIIIPITNMAYDSTYGGILAAVLTGISFAYIERYVRKVVPETLDMFLTPLFTIIIGGFLSVLVYQYMGTLLTDIIFIITGFIFNELGIFGGFILSAIQLPLVSLGLHRVFVPLHAILSDPEGATQGVNYLLPILMVAGGGQVGAAFALYVKTKNETLKRAILATMPAGILGVGEPLMYAVTLPLIRPFLTACIGSGFGGIMIVLLKVGAISQGVSGVMAPLIMNSGSRWSYLIGLLTAYIAGFIITYFFGYKEENVDMIFKQ